MEVQSFGVINYIVVGVYLLAIMGLGMYFSKRQKSTDDYFKAGGRIPGWAAGISIFATTLSSITFMSIPAKVYTDDWTFLIGSFLVILMLPFIYMYYIPFLRKLNIISIYEYLENRFDVRLRIFSSISFILFQVGRIAIILYLTVLGLSPFISVYPLIMVFFVGILCIAYTFMGGIEGVIWTDVVQGIMLSVAAVFMFLFLCYQVDGGFVEIFKVTAESDKYFSESKFEWSWQNSTIPVLFIGFFFANLQQYTASQDVVQRYVVTKSISETKKTMLTTAKFAIFIVPFFFAVGSGLFVFYQQNITLLPEGFNTGGIVPYYILTQLPAGISGLIVAAIFAASQSSISSSLNSISACFTFDIYNRLGSSKSEKNNFNVGRMSTVAFGILGVVASTYLIYADESELWDAFNSLIGLMGGPITGLFMLGLFVKKANANSALLGVVVSVISVLSVRAFTDLNFFFYGAISTLLVVIIGYLTAPLFSIKEQKVFTE